MPPAQIKAAIFEHPEFVTYTQTVDALFAQWEARNMPELKGIKIGDHPKQLIAMLAEDLLQTFSAAALIDRYDVYQP